MITTSPSIPDIESVRRLYPGLETDTVLLENAGGSQVPLFVADAIRDHLLHDYVQLGAGYPASDRATATVERAHRFLDRYVNGEGIGRVILGSSCTSLMHVLAHAIAPTIQAGDEIVVCEQGHEANIGCWLELEARGPLAPHRRDDGEHALAPVVRSQVHRDRSTHITTPTRRLPHAPP